jgi:hypothetical protein
VYILVLVMTVLAPLFQRKSDLGNARHFAATRT